MSYRVLGLATLLSVILVFSGCGSGFSSSNGKGPGNGGSGGGTPRSVSSVAVTPSTVTLTVNATQQLQANAKYSDNSAGDITATATWTSSDIKVATVSATGLVTAVAAGTATITAKSGEQSGTSIVTVTAAPSTVTSVAVTPSSVTLTANGTQQLQANANYSDHSASDVTASAVWTSSDTTIATVSKTGLVSAVAPGSATISAKSGGQTGTSSVTVNPAQRVLTSINITPANPSLSAGSTQQLKATATYNDNSMGDVTATVTWTSSAPSVATVNAAGLLSAVAQGTATISAVSGSVSATDSITITPSTPPTGNINITTFHYDNHRSGLDNSETILTPANVKPATFGKLFSLTVDGYVYAQPLYMSGLTINGARHNVLFVSTEKDIVYAFDADSANGNAPLWQTSLLATGETPAPGGNPSPYHGSTSTPVIDASTKTVYVVSQQSSGGVNNFRLNAIDITTGNILKTASVTAQVSPALNSEAVNGVLTMSQGCLQRSALLLDYGTIYFAFSACGSGWLLSYDEVTLSQKAIFAVGPNNDGNGNYKGDGGIWMGGSGPISDGAGNVYVTTGNGPYNNASQAYGDSILRLDSNLALKDWFTPEDYLSMQCNDSDLSGGGAMMMPNGNIVAGGKSGRVFQVDSANLGQGPHAGNTGAVTTLFPGDNVGMQSYAVTCTSYDTTNPPNGQPYPTATWDGTKTPYQLFGTAAYYNNSVYLGMTPGPVVQLTSDASGKLSLTNNSTAQQIATSSFGTTPVISANNNTNAVLWFIDHGSPLQSGTPTNAVLRAYDPAHLSSELYDSSISGSDTAGFGVKFSAPVVANGKVYIATGNDARLATDSKGEIDVYGLK
jgi:uncharacterized protein YjdB